MDKVLITGGSGFIGGHLTEQLIKKGCKVTVYDIKPSWNKEVNYIFGDIMDYSRLKSAVEGHKTVCHLAAMVGVTACLSDENQVYRINLEGTKNIIRACREAGVENLLFTSSSEVYGEGSPFKILDESMEVRPISHYGKSKLYSEWLMREFSEEAGIKVTVLRYCNIYGVCQRKEFVVSIFIDSILHSKPIRICGNGEQLRSFTYVDDAVEGTIKALFRNDTGFEIFNIGSSSNIKIKELAEKIMGFGSSSKIEYVSFEYLKRKPECEILYRIPSIEKARKYLGYSDSTSLDKGLAITYDYYKGVNKDCSQAVGIL
jgi:UDP-glucose 4-epimerase